MWSEHVDYYLLNVSLLICYYKSMTIGVFTLRYLLLILIKLIQCYDPLGPRVDSVKLK